jgi:hypothetical protein
MVGERKPPVDLEHTPESEVEVELVPFNGGPAPIHGPREDRPRTLRARAG